MKAKHDLHTVLPYPRNRLLMVDGGRMGRQKHTVHGLVEFDITIAREAIRQHKAQTGEVLSFSAFFLACLGKAIDQNKLVHAYRNWRRQLIIFDEVDVNTLFEVDVAGKKTIRPHILRGVNKKTFREIHAEIRAFQQEHQSSQESKFIDWFVLLPGFARRMFLWVLFKNPPLDPGTSVDTTSNATAACSGVFRWLRLMKLEAAGFLWQMSLSCRGWRLS